MPIAFFIQAHEDFILTAGCAYFLSYILQFFDMNALTDEPQHPLLRKNMKMMHKPKKEEIFSQLLGEIIDKLLLTFPEKVCTCMLYSTVYIYVCMWF